MNNTEQLNFGQNPLQSPEALNEQREARAKFEATSARSDMLISKYRTDKGKEDSYMAKLPDTEKGIVGAENLYSKQLSLKGLTEGQGNAGKEIQRAFNTLGAKGKDVIKKLQNPLKDEQKRFLFGGFYKDLLVAKKNIQTLSVGSGMSLNEPPEALEEINATLAEYEALHPDESAELFTPIQVGTNDEEFEKKLNTTGRMMLVVLGAAYTLFAVVTGMKTKNYTPAIIGAIATAAAIFGTKRLLEGPGSRVVREMGFLDSKEYDDFFDANVDKEDKDKWADYVAELQKNPPSLSRLKTIRKSSKTDPEKDTEITKLFSLDSAKDPVKGKVQDMIKKLDANEEDTNDLSILISFAERGTHSDTNKDIVSYIRNGGRSKDIKVVKDPTKVLEAEAAKIPTLPS